jgi:KaiC/GvpD/RAD55 family RecA-like ATPase
MENTPTDEKMFSMRLKAFVPMMFAIVIGTNTVSLTIQRVSDNEEQIQYSTEANKRRLKHATKELNYEHKIQHLEKELSECNNIKK